MTSNEKQTGDRSEERLIKRSNNGACGRKERYVAEYRFANVLPFPGESGKNSAGAESICGSLRRRFAQFDGSEISKRSVPNVQNPDCLANIIHFVEDAPSVFPIAEKKTSDRSPRFRRFTSQGTPVGKLFKRIKAINEFLEPLGPPDRGSLDNPIVDLVCIGPGRLSENDFVSHVFPGTLFQTASMPSHDRLRRRRVRA
jgi:hypothetical protein